MIMRFVLFSLFAISISFVHGAREETKIYFESGWRVRILEEKFVLVTYGSSAAHMAQVHNSQITARSAYTFLLPDLDARSESQPKNTANYLCYLEPESGKKFYHAFKKFDQTKLFVNKLISLSSPLSPDNFSHVLTTIPVLDGWTPQFDKNKQQSASDKRIDVVTTETKESLTPSSSTSHNLKSTNNAEAGNVSRDTHIRFSPHWAWFFVPIVLFAASIYLLIRRS